MYNYNICCMHSYSYSCMILHIHACRLVCLVEWLMQLAPAFSYMSTICTANMSLHVMSYMHECMGHLIVITV